MIVTRATFPTPLADRHDTWRRRYKTDVLRLVAAVAVRAELIREMHRREQRKPQPAVHVADRAGKPAATREPRGWSPNAAAQPLLDAGTRTAPPATDFPEPPADVPEVITDPAAYGRAYAEAEAASADYTD